MDLLKAYYKSTLPQAKCNWLRNLVNNLDIAEFANAEPFIFESNQCKLNVNGPQMLYSRESTADKPELVTHFTTKGLSKFEIGVVAINSPEKITNGISWLFMEESLLPGYKISPNDYIQIHVTKKILTILIQEKLIQIKLDDQTQNYKIAIKCFNGTHIIHGRH